MQLELTDEERDFLQEILRDRMGTLREQVYHTTTSTFKQQLKERESLLQSMIDKLDAQGG